MALRGSTKITKLRGQKCSTANVLKLLLAFTLILFAASILITLNLTTSVRTVDARTNAKSIETPLKLRNGKARTNKATVSESKRETSDGSPSSTSDHKLLHWIKEQKNDDKLSSLSEMLSEPLYYPPGTLPLSQLDTFQHCYTDPLIYGDHLHNPGPKRRAPYSEKHKLALVLVPKSGSSTGRFMMKHEFEAEEKYVTLEPPLNVITFVREPLSRFMSQYDEAYVRTAPWSKSDNQYYIDPDTKTQKKQHPFPYLFENMHTYRDYEDVFCPPSTRTNPNSRKECLDKKSAENGTLTHRLERFVNDYDGRTPFDVHLKWQVPFLSNNDGTPMYLTELYNTTNSNEDWTVIAKRYMGEDHVFKNKDGVIEGRSYPRRFNSKLVSAETKKRICELALIDYCCLNFPLPEDCDDGSSKLTCKMDYNDVSKRFRVQPGFFPGKKK